MGQLKSCHDFRSVVTATGRRRRRNGENFKDMNLISEKQNERLRTSRKRPPGDLQCYETFEDIDAAIIGVQGRKRLKTAKQEKKKKSDENSSIDINEEEEHLEFRESKVRDVDGSILLIQCETKRLRCTHFVIASTEINHGSFGSVRDIDGDDTKVAKVIPLDNTYDIVSFLCEKRIALLASREDVGPAIHAWSVSELITPQHTSYTYGILVMDKYESLPKNNTSLLLECATLIFDLINRFHNMKNSDGDCGDCDEKDITNNTTAGRFVHGDLYERNIMYRRDDDNKIKVVLIDFGQAIYLAKSLPQTEVDHFQLSDIVGMLWGHISVDDIVHMNLVCGLPSLIQSYFDSLPVSNYTSEFPKKFEYALRMKVDRHAQVSMEMYKRINIHLPQPLTGHDAITYYRSLAVSVDGSIRQFRKNNPPQCHFDYLCTIDEQQELQNFISNVFA